MKKVKTLLVALILSLMVVAPTTALTITTPQTVEAAAKINVKKVTLIKGQTKQLKITGTSKKPTWTSNNRSVATVNKKGVVTAKKKGNAVITAKVGKSKYSCRLTVQSPALNKTKITISKGKKYNLKLNGTNQKVSWKSSNSKVASVSSSGIVTGKKSGTCKIYATVLGKRFSCSVTIKKPVQQKMVWLPATGEKYHTIPNCGRMNPNRAYQVTLSEALSLGYTACSKCF